MTPQLKLLITVANAATIIERKLVGNTLHLTLLHADGRRGTMEMQDCDEKALSTCTVGQRLQTFIGVLP